MKTYENGVDYTENTGRTELEANRMWGELAWDELHLGLNVWHPGESIIFEELSPAYLINASSVAELRSPKGELYKKTTLLSYRQGIQRY